MDAVDIRVEYGNAIAYTPADVALARTIIRNYVRGVGCPSTDDGEWPNDLLAVTHLLATRLHCGDFTRTTESIEADEFSQHNFRPFRGLSLIEQLMLGRYRRRIM